MLIAKLKTKLVEISRFHDFPIPDNYTTIGDDFELIIVHTSFQWDIIHR
jgi:hypothetical protein